MRKWFLLMWLALVVVVWPLIGYLLPGVGVVGMFVPPTVLALGLIVYIVRRFGVPTEAKLDEILVELRLIREALSGQRVG